MVQAPTYNKRVARLFGLAAQLVLDFLVIKAGH